MLVTIFADASHDTGKKLGGWGAWAKSERGSASWHGAFKKPVATSTEAELFAAVNAVFLTVGSSVYERGDLLLVQSDCLAVVEVLNRTAKSRDWQQEGMIRLHEIMIRAAVRGLTARHVPGHTKGEVPRLWVNNLCDSLARKGIDKARQGLDAQG
jgi:ribonuclease HI